MRVRSPACRFSAERGEIVGIAGLAGSGRDSVLGASFGALPRAAGEVKMAGKPLPPSRPDVAIGQRRGVPRARPEDRRRRHDDERAREPDAAGPQAVLEGRDRAPQGREGADEGVVRAAVGAGRRTPSRSRSSIFSGGNQQKILFGKWLSQKPAVFLLDEPTQGVDVGAKADLHRELVTAAEDGAAVVVSSSDLEELADLCDRVLVIVDGKISERARGRRADRGQRSRAGSCRSGRPGRGAAPTARA